MRATSGGKRGDRNGRLRAAFAVATAAVMLVGAESAAAGSWAPQSVAAKQGNNGRSVAVSCAAQTSCMAVGSFLTPAGKQRALAQRWDGSSWTLTTVPVPTGATKTRLAGVSCTAADACTAVGMYALPVDQSGGSRDQNAFVVRWNGTAWARQTVPLPAGTVKSYLNGVSCTATGGCKAVGGYRNGTHQSAALVEHWNGSSWTFRTPDNPAGANFTSLNGISCVGTECIAVGSYRTQPSAYLPGKTFAARFSRSVWSLQSLPEPSGSVGATLTGVSCTAANACTAVGGYSTSGYDPDTPFVARYDGTGWTQQATPAKPTGVLRRSFKAVSCSSATSCTAVGPDMDTVGETAGRPHVERWDGAAWTVQAAPKPAGRDAAWFGGVSCKSGCTAVGGASVGSEAGASSTALAERQPAGSTSWTVQTSRNGVGAFDTSLMDVSCATATHCVGVGNSFTPTAGSAVIRRWNGSSWASQTPGAALAQGRRGDTLRAVSCASATACMAVGVYGAPTNGTALPLAQRWNGTSWTSMRMPVPAGGSSVYMESVACVSATECIAVGFVDISHRAVPLVERWNGSEWSIQNTPAAPGAGRATLEDVSCSAAGACTAVGGYDFSQSGGGTRPLILRLDGATWTRQDAALPGGVQWATLNGVSCTAPAPCTAVGGSSTSSPYYGTDALVERWDGTSWALQSAPYGGSTDVSCPTLSSCMAIGATSPSQLWDGASWSWAGPGLVGVQYSLSCSAALACTSVGYQRGSELVVEDVFAGLVYANETTTPVAARYSSSGRGAAAEAAKGATRTLTAPGQRPLT